MWEEIRAQRDSGAYEFEKNGMLLTDIVGASRHGKVLSVYRAGVQDPVHITFDTEAEAEDTLGSVKSGILDMMGLKYSVGNEGVK